MTGRAWDGDTLRAKDVSYVVELAPSPLAPKHEDSRAHLEMVFMSRLIASHVVCTCGALPAGHDLVLKMLRHGLNDGYRVADLELVLGRPRQLLRRDLARYGLSEPSHWLAVCRILYAVWVHFRLRGTFASAIEHLGMGSQYDLSAVCKRVTGIRPGEAHRECREANSILPFMDRCIPYLSNTSAKAA